MDFFPVFLKLKDQACLIVGGGEIAARKADLLLACGAQLRVVSPTLCANLSRRLQAEAFEHLARAYAPGDEAGMRLVIAATDEPAINASVHQRCEAANIWINVVDDPEHCRFIVPSIVDRSPLIVAVSSGGLAPVLARHVRARIEAWLPHGYGLLARLAGNLRERVKARFAEDAGARRRFWEIALESPAAEKALAGDEAGARAGLETLLSQARGDALREGAVYLVGAGPGNPDLLTFRALRLMQKADVVLYDNLVSPAIMALVRREAERVYVGKKASHHALPQEEINALLVRLAREGKAVLRLKGGDPFIFGRGGEEIEELASHGISFEVVPGITSASGAACYAGIPLTHRDHAQSVSFVTGHRRNGEVELDWARLTSPSETLVIYMGVKEAPQICARLIEHGRAADTPIAIVEKATLPEQRTLVGTLASLPALMREQAIKPPALIIVGSVVSLHQKLDWLHQNDPARQ